MAWLLLKGSVAVRSGFRRGSYIRDLYQRFVIKIHHLPTEDMPADIFTKALPQEKFTKFRAILLNV